MSKKNKREKQARIDGGTKNRLEPAKPEKLSSSGWQKSCKHGSKIHHVLTIGKAKVWAGAAYDFRDAIRDGMEFALLVSVGGSSTATTVAETTTTFGPKAAQMAPDLARYAAHGIRERMIVVDWPDMGAPPVSSDWWEKLYETLAKRVEGNVGFFCIGGHGRTGTSLAILSFLNNDVPEGEDVIAWVRGKYCDHAVESQSQMRYLKDLGIVSEAKGYKESGYSSALKGSAPTGKDIVTTWTNTAAPTPEPILAAMVEGADTCDMCHDEKGQYIEEMMAFIGPRCVKLPEVMSHLTRETKDLFKIA